MQERYIGLLQVSKTDSKSLLQSVKEMLLKYELQLENVHGQGYDGAAATNGQYSGLQSRIMAENDKAILYRTLAKEGPLQIYRPTPHFELSFLLRSQVYLNKRPYVSALEYARAITI